MFLCQDYNIFIPVKWYDGELSLRRELGWSYEEITGYTIIISKLDSYLNSTTVC